MQISRYLQVTFLYVVQVPMPLSCLQFSMKKFGATVRGVYIFLPQADRMRMKIVVPSTLWIDRTLMSETTVFIHSGLEHCRIAG